MTEVMLDTQGLTVAEAAIVAETLVLVHRIVNDVNFLAAVENASYDHFLLARTRSVPRVTGQTVRTIIATGEEMSEGNVGVGDGKMQFVVTKGSLVNQFRAATDLGRQPIHLDTRFLDDCLATRDVVSLASVLLHEWMHVAGFEHAPHHRALDVPWVIDDLAMQFGVQHANGAAPANRAAPAARAKRASGAQRTNGPQPATRRDPSVRCGCTARRTGRR